MLSKDIWLTRVRRVERKEKEWIDMIKGRRWEDIGEDSMLSRPND